VITTVLVVCLLVTVKVILVFAMAHAMISERDWVKDGVNGGDVPRCRVRALADAQRSHQRGVRTDSTGIQSVPNAPCTTRPGRGLSV
jgi:hypothetical protein